MDRGARLNGRSHMNLASLVAHGISGIATFSETVATRILISSIAGLLLLIGAFGPYLVLSLWVTHTVPSRATYTSNVILVLFSQILWIAFSLVFSLISNRTTMQFVPIRDYEVFVSRLEHLPDLG